MLLHRRDVLRTSALAALLVALPGRADAAAIAPSDWMSALPGSTPLWRLTIPGTHDTCARYGGDAVQCQTTSVAEQLAAGHRFLDIRCRATGGSFAIHHGPVYQKLMFGDVLGACWDFLAAHPGETVLMRVKQEYSTVSDAEFGAIFADYLDRRGWRSLFRLDSDLPTLDGARGRVVLIGDNGGIPGIRWGGELLDIQDAWDVPTVFHRERKWQQVLGQLGRAAANTAPKLFVNFGSGSSAGCYPYSVASYVDPRLRDYLAGGPHRPLGVVVTDYAERYTPTLTAALIGWNSPG